MKPLDNKTSKVQTKENNKHSKEPINIRQQVKELFEGVKSGLVKKNLQTQKFITPKNKKTIICSLNHRPDVNEIREAKIKLKVKSKIVFKIKPIKPYSAKSSDITALESSGFKIKKNILTNKPEILNKIKSKPKLNIDKSDIIRNIPTKSIVSNIEIGTPPNPERIVPKKSNANAKQFIIKNLKEVYKDG